MTGQPATRRTQQERTAAARENLIAATQDCLSTVGLARTTVSEICKRAGVSSGAMLHHFPNKNALIVAAFIDRQAQLIDATVERAQIGQATIRDEVIDLRRQMEKTFSLSYEFFSALRTDADLRTEFQSQLHASEIALSSRFTFGESDLNRSGSPLITRSVIVCFLRGLLLESLISDRDTVERLCEYFIEALTAFVQKQAVVPKS